jgi:hypothetical protein
MTASRLAMFASVADDAAELALADSGWTWARVDSLAPSNLLETQGDLW